MAGGCGGTSYVTREATDGHGEIHTTAVLRSSFGILPSCIVITQWRVSSLTSTAGMCGSELSLGSCNSVGLMLYSYVEGIVRGYRNSLLTGQHYNNLTQCETIDGPFAHTYRYSYAIYLSKYWLQMSNSSSPPHTETSSPRFLPTPLPQPLPAR